MASFRIQTFLLDRSQVAIPTGGINGAIIVRSSKGNATPVKIEKGDTDRIINLFGLPSVNFPQVWECINFNNAEPLWISAPALDADTLGGVSVSKFGSIPLADGVTIADLDTYVFPTPTVTVTETVGTGNGTLTSFSHTLSNAPVTPTSSNFDILNGSTDLGVTVGALASSVYPITGTGLTTGSQYDPATKIVTLVFTVAPTTADVFKVRYNTVTSTYFSLFATSPYADDLAVKVTYNSITEFFTINLYKLNSAGDYALLNTYIVSTIFGTKDGFGKSVYILDVLKDNDFIQALINTSNPVTSFVDDITTIAFAGGARDTDTLAVADIVNAWDNFKKVRTYPARIFMSPEADELIAAKFDELRKGAIKFGKFILPLPMDQDVSDAIETKASYSINERGLRFYWNWFLASTTYGQFWTSAIGRVGVKHAQMKDIFFGKAPAWIDEDNHGGQLGSGFLKAAYDPSEEQLQQLDQAGINPIVFDPSYGVMITSQRTGQSPSLLSDTSWIAHSDLFDYIIENIVGSVLTFQICKLNDPTHRTLALTKANQLTGPIVGSSLLAECQHKCDSGNNNAAALAARQFILTTAVKVTPFSETLKFNLIATSQEISVSQVLQ